MEESDNISKKRPRKTPQVAKAVAISQEPVTETSDATTGRRYNLRSSVNKKDKEVTHNINESSGENTQSEAEDALANNEGVDANSSKTLNIRYRRNRGPTRFATESRNTDKVEIICNLNGQPVGENSTKFASYLGVIVREIIPITHKNWKAVPMEVKNQILTLITQKYIFLDIMKKWVFMTMAKQWREYKHRLVKNHYDKYDNDVDRITNPPPRVSQKDWEYFVNCRSNIDFKAMRQRNKQNRSRQSIMHTCSRRGYARLEHEMSKSQPNVETPLSRATVWMAAHIKKDGAPISPKVAETIKKLDEALLSPSCVNESINHDALNKVLGREKPGWVRGVGKGVTPSAMFAGEGYIRKLIQMQEHMAEKEKKLEEKFAANEKKLEEKLAEKDEKIEEILTRLSQIEAASALTTLAIGHNVDCGFQGTGTSSITSRPESSMGLKTTLITQTGRRECYLTQIHEDHIVAEGTVISTNPEELVHGERLGEHYWKVNVHVAHKEETILFRRNDEMAIMKDAVGSFIAWPISDIVYK